MDMHTIGKNVVNKERSEVDIVMTTVETRVHYEILTAIENLVMPRVELAMKSVIASSGRRMDNFVMDADQRVFSGTIEGVQLTASSRLSVGFSRRQPPP